MVWLSIIIRNYCSQNVKWYVVLQVYISWLLSFGVIILLPIDIYYTLLYQENKNDYAQYSNKKILILIWRIMFWASQIFTWIILPLFQEYAGSGEFSRKRKFIIAIKNNLYLYGIALVLIVIFLIYMAAKNTFKNTSFFTYLIAMANSFGIFLITMLLGYGLVAIPRNWWRCRSFPMTLKFYYFQAHLLEESKAQADYDLEENLKIALALNENQLNLGEEYIHLLEILSIIPEEKKNEVKQILNLTIIKSLTSQFGAPTREKLVSLHSKIKSQQAASQRAEAKWEDILERAFFIQDVINSQNLNDQKIKSYFWNERQSAFGSIIDHLCNFIKIILQYFVQEWLWHTKIRIKFNYIMTFTLVFFSLMIFFGEITLYLKDIKISLFGYAISKKLGYFGIQFFTLISFSLLCYLTYYGLFKLKFAGFFGLYKPKQTDSASLLFYSINFLRVAYPLCFNFLKLLKIENCSFNEVMGELDLVPFLGENFTVFFPTLLILLCFLTSCDIYSKLLNYFGLKQFTFSSDFADEGIIEGQNLINQARVKRENLIVKLPNYENIKLRGYKAYMFKDHQKIYEENQFQIKQKKYNYDMGNFF